MTRKEKKKTQGKILPGPNRLQKIYYFAGMKHFILPGFFLLFVFSGCQNPKDSSVTSENDLDAARNFIRAALDGEYEKGRNLLLADSTNYQFYQEYEKYYDRMTAEEKNKYKSSSINVHALTPVNDSTTLIIFSNSYKNDHDTLKLVKTSGQWRVDLKYLFNHEMDTLAYFLNQKDSLRQ